MRPGFFTVSFPGGSVEVRRGTVLSRALNMDRLRVETPCGGKGRCRKCIVRVVSGSAPVTSADGEMLWPDEVAAGHRLACRCLVESDMEIAFLEGQNGGEDEVFHLVGERVEREPEVSDFALAIDLGTTTIAGTLLRLPEGREVTSGTVANPQARDGLDVMARLAVALRSQADRDRLQSSVLLALASLTKSLTRAAGVALDRVSVGVLVGNSAMHHLALGFDISTLCVSPYRPSVLGEVRNVGFPGIPSLYVPPLVGGFVGSDTVAACLAEGLYGVPGVRLFVDIGTNSEIVLAVDGELMACSAPAGPAFEGAEISQGMSASIGAIDSVRVDGDALHSTVIGNVAPRGLCGSGIVDAVAALRTVGAIDQDGRLTGNSTLRAIADDRGYLVALELVEGIFVTQKDVRAVQLAKGAVRSGVDILMSLAGVGPQDVDEVLLAGTFGAQVYPTSAKTIGLLPAIPPERVKNIGNAALRGAKMMAVSEDARVQATAIAKAMRHIALEDRPSFQDVFLRCLSLG